MAFDRVLNVAKKEFSDHITSRRFIIILALFLVISTVSIHEGIELYNTRLEMYNEQLQQMTAGFEGLYPGQMPEKPSIMLVFLFMMGYMTALGSILALAVGFDLVTKEKESRSLKSLLSHPVYRDEIINGKMLGGVGALGFAMALALALSLAMLLVFSVVPTLGEFAAILIFGAASLGLLLAYFAIVSTLLPAFGTMAADVFAGDPPEPPETVVPMPTPAQSSGGGYVTADDPRETDPAWKDYEEARKTYIEKRRLISDISSILSPQANYVMVSLAVTDPGSSTMYTAYGAVQAEPGGLADALGRIWMNIAAIIVFPAAFFAATYVKFMRMDIR